MYMRLAIATLCLAVGSVASGQVLPGDTPPTDDGSQNQPFGGGQFSHASAPHISTEESVMRGFADVVRSQGMRNLQDSEAIRNLEEARREYIENRLRATEVYFDRRRINDEFRRSQRGSPLSFEAYVRLARAQAPERLSLSQLDAVTGAIYWPPVLRDKVYDADRQLIERLYRQRATGVASNLGEIQTACDRFLEKLKADIEAHSPNDFIVAQRFINSLKYEAQMAQRAAS